MSSRVEHKHIKVMNATRDLLPAHNAEIAIFTISTNQRCSRANDTRGSVTRTVEHSLMQLVILLSSMTIHRHIKRHDIKFTTHQTAICHVMNMYISLCIFHLEGRNTKN